MIEDDIKLCHDRIHELEEYNDKLLLKLGRYQKAYFHACSAIIDISNVIKKWNERIDNEP